MADPVTDAVSEAKQIFLTDYEIWSMIASFVFGGFTSAIWTLRDGKKPKWNEVVSTFFVSGLISVGFICWLLRYNIEMPSVIGVSILCGFAGDALVRAVIRGVIKVAEAIFAPSLMQILTGKKLEKGEITDELK